MDRCTILSILLVVVVWVCPATAAQEGACCMPEKFQGQMRATKYIFSYGKVTTIQSESNRTYDAVEERRVDIVNKSDSDGNSRHFQSLALYRDKAEYDYDLNGGSCTVTYLFDVFPKLCLPGNTRVVDPTINFRTGEISLSASRVKFDLPSKDGKLSGDIIVTKDCVPILGVVTKTSFNPLAPFQIRIYTYEDVTEGIASEDVFSIPEACPGFRKGHGVFA